MYMYSYILYMCVYIHIYIYIHTYTYVYGGFYFVRVMKVYSEVFSLNGAIWGVTLGTGRGGTKVTPKFVSFSVSVLAKDTNKVESAICVYRMSTYDSQTKQTNNLHAIVRELCPQAPRPWLS